MTREEYMTYDESETRRDASIRHHKYYLQFAKGMRSSCSNFCSVNNFTIDHIRKCFSKDEHLNNLDDALTHKVRWITLMNDWIEQNSSQVASINFKLNGERTYCIADGCCILKAYMIDMAGIYSDSLVYDANGDLVDKEAGSTDPQR